MHTPRDLLPDHELYAEGRAKDRPKEEPEEETEEMPEPEDYAERELRLEDDERYSSREYDRRDESE